LREDLAKICNVRRRFEGTFVRFGQRSGYKGVLTTILLKNVRDISSGKTVTDHLWFTMGKGFEKLALKEDDVIRFDARVTEYVKGYKGNCNDDEEHKPLERDFRLSFPTKFVKVSKKI